VRVRAAVAVLFAASALVHAQGPSLSGTWKLDREKSRIAADTAFVGLIAAGAPERLHVTQPANGTLVIESEVNEGHVRIYTPRAKSTTPVAFQGGTIAMTSAWKGAAMAAEGTFESPSGTTTVVKQVKEVIGLTPDGRSLSIQITMIPADTQPLQTTLIYERTATVDPCEKWSTPCKRPK
jgi:hypothetical protein